MSKKCWLNPIALYDKVEVYIYICILDDDEHYYIYESFTPFRSMT